MIVHCVVNIKDLRTNLSLLKYNVSKLLREKAFEKVVVACFGDVLLLLGVMEGDQVSLSCRQAPSARSAARKAADIISRAITVRRDLRLHK